MRISDWSSDVCSSDLSSLLAWLEAFLLNIIVQKTIYNLRASVEAKLHRLPLPYFDKTPRGEILSRVTNDIDNISSTLSSTLTSLLTSVLTVLGVLTMMFVISRSEEHTSELQSLMRISYDVFCLKKKIHNLLYNKPS